MAAVTPSDFFTGLELLSAGGTATAESIAIPLASLSGLVSAEADPATGDGREVARILAQTIADKFAALGAAAPSFMSVTQPNLSAVSASRVRKQIILSFDIDIPATDLQMPDEV
jgi:hypothetical protein